MKDIINKASRQVINYAIKNHISEIIIGYNSIYNIKCTIINESNTSICSFYDNEEIKYHLKYKGKRITRSLFQTSTNKIINADINGALNIMAKSKTDRTDILSFLRNIGQTVPIRQKIKFK